MTTARTRSFCGQGGLSSLRPVLHPVFHPGRSARITPVSRRLLWSLLGASLVLNVMYGAIAGVLVPAQIAQADPESKETSLAVVMAISSLITLVVRPAVGALSDRTRGRWGRRTPWMIGGSLAVTIAMLPLGHATTVLAIGAGWLIVQPLLNVVEVPLDTVMADRFAPGQRPRAGAFYGAGIALGLGLGAAIAGVVVSRVDTVYPMLGALLAVTMIAFATLNPDATTTGESPALPWRRAWAHRNVQLVFFGRLILVLGHQLVQGYLLYIVMAFTDAPVEDAGGTVSLLIAMHLVCVVVGAGFAAHRVGDHRVRWLLAGTAVIAVGLLVLLAQPNLTGLVVYSATAGLGRGVYLTADLALMIDVLPSTASHGRDLGLLGLATILPQVLAPALAGALLAASGSEYRLLVLTAVLGVLASMLVISRVRTTPGQSSSP